MKNLRTEALKAHKKYRGKLNVVSKVPLKTLKDMSLFYTPGVAEPCKEIFRNKECAYDYTSKGHTIAVVTDGSAVDNGNELVLNGTFEEGSETLTLDNLTVPSVMSI